MTSTGFPSSSLQVEWKRGVHKGCPTVHVQRLPRGIAGFVHAQEHHGVPDVCRGGEPSHRRPATRVPGLHGVLHLLRQCPKNSSFYNVRRAFPLCLRFSLLPTPSFGAVALCTLDQELAGLLILALAGILAIENVCANRF